MNNYDAWRTGYYELDDDDNATHFTSEQYDIYEAQDIIACLQDAIYETGNINKIIRCMEDLADALDVCRREYTGKEPAIEKKNENRLMHWYLGYQRKYIEDMKEAR